MSLRTTRLAILALLIFSAPVTAQWPDDPDLNLAIADRADEQVIPKLAGFSDGGTYVGWFDHSSGSYAVYLQHLDAGGFELWPHDGILVSDHPQGTSLVDWDLIADSAGNAVLVFSDTRGAGDLDVQAYKIGPGGQFLWGPDGISLSASSDYEPAPRVAEATDGDIVVVWSRLPNAGDGKITMQRLSAGGALRFPAGGLPIAGDPGEDAAFPAIVPADGGSVIVSWVRDISTFQSPRHVRARKFGPDGSPLWAGHVDVFDGGSVPIAYLPKLHADGAGGALVLWHRSLGNAFNSFVQHLSASGNELFAHNGVAVSTAGGNHIDPALAYRFATGESFIFWNERNANQSEWGIYAQKITAGGGRAWGESGIELQPVNTIYKSAPRCVPLGDGAAVFYADEPGGQFNRDRVLGIRVDAGGNSVWPGSPVVVSSHLSSKARLPVTIDPTEVTKLVWEDDRSGNPDVYGQNVNADGTLGAAPTGIGGEAGATPGMLRLLPNRPNPFRGRTEIPVAGPPPLWPGVEIVITDAAGHTVRRIALMDPEGSSLVAWDGRGADGRFLPSGVYFYRLCTPMGESAPWKATLVH